MSSDGDDADHKGPETNGGTSSVVISEEFVDEEPVDTPGLFEVKKTQLGVYRHLFASEEQFEYFCMFPINKQQRQILIKEMLNPRPQPTQAASLLSVEK